MYNTIWTTYDHYSSIDEKRYHNRCPTGVESWCTWQHASAKRELASFKHYYKPLPPDVLITIKPIYEDLSKDTLLKRCLVGFN